MPAKPSQKNKRLPSFEPQVAIPGDVPNLISCAKALGFKTGKIDVVNPELKKTTIPFIFPNAIKWKTASLSSVV